MQTLNNPNTGVHEGFILSVRLVFFLILTIGIHMYAQGLIKLHISVHISHSKITHSKVPKLYVCLQVYFCIDILYIALLHILCTIKNKNCDKSVIICLLVFIKLSGCSFMAQEI